MSLSCLSKNVKGCGKYQFGCLDDESQQTADTTSNMQRLKFLLAPASSAEVGDSINISNKLAGLEYKYFDPSETISSNLRVLEFNWNATQIELWNIPGVEAYNRHIPAVCFMDSSGFIIVANEAPIDLIQRNNDLFNSEAFPVLWYANDNYYKSKMDERALSDWNVELVRYTSPNDSLITTEFSNWLTTVNLYLNRK